MPAKYVNSFLSAKDMQLLIIFKDCLAYNVKQVSACLHVGQFGIKLVRALKKQKSIFLKSRIR